MPGPPPSTPAICKRKPLHVKILLGLLIGAGLGLICNVLASQGWIGPEATQAIEWTASNLADPIGRIFLRLILMVVLPLVFSALALGVYELGDVRRLGSVGLRTLGLTILASGCAVALGIGLVSLIRPGESLSVEKRDELRRQYQDDATQTVSNAAQAKSIKDTLLDIIPENPLQEMVGALDGSSPGNGLLSVMFFSLAIGVALLYAGPRTATLLRLLEGTFDVSMAVIGFAMKLAPHCVACLLFSVTSRLGADILLTLVWFVLTVLVGMLLQLVVVYGVMLRWLGKRSPLEFYRDIFEAMLTAFATSSSNATLPTSLRVARERLGLPADISQFVLTIGSTGNQNGTALYEGVVVLFLAQLFGVELTLLQQLVVVLMSMLAGVGTAGVPGGSLPLIVVVLGSVGVPGEGIGIVLGIDRILDMCRTVLNVTGDLVLATCVAAQSPGPHQEKPLPVTNDT